MTPEYRRLLIHHAERYRCKERALAVKHRANDAYIRSLYEDAEGIGGIDYSKVMVSSMPNLDALPNSVANLVDMKREAEADAAEYFEMKRQARRLLDEMDGTYGRLLLLRYVTALPWVRVADILNYDENYCRQMKRDALRAFYDYLPTEYKVGGTHAILDADFATSNTI